MTFSGSSEVRAPSISAHEAHFNHLNVARDYHNHSQTNVKNVFSGRHPLDRLVDSITPGAINDSDERFNAPKCTLETRIAVQGEIMTWIAHGNGDAVPRRMLWITGPAGTGKTAIAGTVADTCAAKGWLAASFFFSSFHGLSLFASQDRRSKRPLIATLVYQLIQHEGMKGFKEAVLDVIGRDPVVLRKSLTQQLEALILGPIRRVAGLSDPSTWPKVIIIDGLDECDADEGTQLEGRRKKEDNQKDILAAFARASSNPAFPFRVIILSRPEAVIREFFSTHPQSASEIFLDNKYNPDSDIAIFLRAKFEGIRCRFNLSEDWVSNETLQFLVGEASGQFIYATTVVRFVEIGTYPPQEQLKRVLQWRRHDRPSTSVSTGPFAPLDALYTHILRTSPNPALAVTWLRAIVTYYDAGFMQMLLESTTGETQHLLGSLPSLINLFDDLGEPVFALYHKSLRDFLEDPVRSASLHVTLESTGKFMVDRFYRTLRNRGPQVLRQTAITTLDAFFIRYSHSLHLFVDLDSRFDSSDVEWWISLVQSKHLHGEQVKLYRHMFTSIHRECSMFSCRSACRVWRAGVLRHCKSAGWKVPTLFETLKDKYRKYNPEFDEDFPLRPGFQNLGEPATPPLIQESQHSTECQMPGAWISDEEPLRRSRI